jgi:tRNA-2-methylthio-N6-dimethylallyladenosine synthase
MNCAFCLVPNTRGKERARLIDDIIEEIEELVAGGTREVTLLGQIVNSYGRREIPFVGGKSPFVQLLERVNDVKGLERIRFTSPHPRGFKQDLVEAYRDLPKLCEYAHLPLQSGSNTILRAMNRPYSRERFTEIIESLRVVVPQIYLSTDIIVGFPGETDKEFEETRDLFERLRFDSGYIFKYSPRPRTAAEPLGDPISREMKEERNQCLLDILRENSLKRNKALVGTVEEVLVEGPARRGDGMYVGRTRGYRKVIFPGRERLVGELVPVMIQEANASRLTGSLVLQGIAE